MITNLSGKHQRLVALFLFFLFYGELAASVYVGKRQILAAKERGMYAIQRHWSSFLARPMFDNNVSVLPGEVIFDKNIDKDKGRKKKKKHEATSHFIGGPSQPEMSGFKSIGADN